MKNKIEYTFFLLFGSLFSLLGPDISRKAAGFLTVIVFYLIPIRKKVVLDNLSNAFPDYSEKRIREIAFGSYRSFMITIIEILCMKNYSRKEIEDQVTVPNKELILEKWNEGKGVILLSAHFGNWEYLAASVSAQINMPLNVIVKPQRNPYVNNWMNSVRSKWMNNVVPLGMSIRQIYQELKNKNIVAMVADQRGPAEGIKLDFFGRLTSVYTGPAVLALKTGSPILFGIALRQSNSTYLMNLYEISAQDLPEDEEGKVTEITRRYIKYLESVIRQHPEQWLWMHKRWKH